MNAIRINDEVYVAEEQGGVHIRAISGSDPAELTLDEARDLRDALSQIISIIENEE